MLFDLRGRRRRAVQAIYLMLALLMGGGLVLFGIGGDVSGGLLDAFRSGGGRQRRHRAPGRRSTSRRSGSRRGPRTSAILQTLVRDYYSLATSKREENSVGFPPDAKDDLRKASSYWKRYAGGGGEPNPDTAGYALQIYDLQALNQPKEAQRVAAILAEDANDTPSYLRLVAYAARAGDTRTADLAAQKAVDLAPKAQRKAVEQQAEH